MEIKDRVAVDLAVSTAHPVDKRVDLVVNKVGQRVADPAVKARMKILRQAHRLN
jgi:hypothetical protein